jgi:hypothetical protein
VTDRPFETRISIVPLRSLTLTATGLPGAYLRALVSASWTMR